MTPNELKQYAKDYKIVPLSRRLYSDVCTPVEALRIVKNVSKHCYVLESMEDAKRWDDILSSAMTLRGRLRVKTVLFML